MTNFICPQGTACKWESSCPASCPNANATTKVRIYSKVPCKCESPLKGVQKLVSNVTYEPGHDNVACTRNNGIKAAPEAVGVMQ